MPFTNKQVGKNAIRIRREQHLISKWGQNISEIFIHLLLLVFCFQNCSDPL